MDPTAPTANPISSDDMIIKLQKQLDDLKRANNLQKSQAIKNLQTSQTTQENITAKDVLSAFEQKPLSQIVPNNQQNSQSNMASNSANTSASTSNSFTAQRYADDKDLDDFEEDYDAATDYGDLPQDEHKNIENEVPLPLNNSDHITHNQPAITNSVVPVASNVASDNAQISIPTPSQPIGSMRKEAIQSTAQPETVRYQEISTELTKDVELENWMKEVPDAKTVTLPKPVADDYGQILVQASQIPKPKIILPISEPEMEIALHHKIIDSFRWLYEWAKRLILLQPGRVFYPGDKKE